MCLGQAGGGLAASFCASVVEASASRSPCGFDCVASFLQIGQQRYMAQPCQPGLHALRTRHKQVRLCKAATQAPESTRHMPQHSLSSPHLETPWARPMTSPLQTAQELLGVTSAGLGTADSLKSLLGVGVVGLAAAAVRQSHNVRPVVRLYDRLLEEAGPLTGARVKMSTDPYRALHQEKALDHSRKPSLEHLRKQTR